MNSSIEIKDLTYDEILDVWKNHLWKDRTDPIKPMSSMLLEGGFDMEIYKIYQPFFSGLFVDGLLVGVNSCHLTSPTQMRSRGLFIVEKYRKNGFAQRLLKAVEEQAISCGCSLVWSYPRLTALSTYERFGFSVYPQTTSASPDHVYVVKKLS